MNAPRSVQLVARNREYPKGWNNVPCVVRSCIKMHATIWNNAPRSVQLVARNCEYPKGLNNVPCVILHSASRGNHSCIKMHATHEIVNTRKGLNKVPCVIRSCIKMHATECESNRQAPIIHRGGGWRFLIMLLLRLWVCVCLAPSLVTCGRKFP